jgi:hypothetical protein
MDVPVIIPKLDPALFKGNTPAAAKVAKDLGKSMRLSYAGMSGQSLSNVIINATKDMGSGEVTYFLPTDPINQGVIDPTPSATPAPLDEDGYPRMLGGRGVDWPNSALMLKAWRGQEEEDARGRYLAGSAGTIVLVRIIVPAVTTPDNSASGAGTRDATLSLLGNITATLAAANANQSSSSPMALLAASLSDLANVTIAPPETNTSGILSISPALRYVYVPPPEEPPPPYGLYAGVAVAGLAALVMLGGGTLVAVRVSKRIVERKKVEKAAAAEAQAAAMETAAGTAAAQVEAAAEAQAAEARAALASLPRTPSAPRYLLVSPSVRVQPVVAPDKCEDDVAIERQRRGALVSRRRAAAALALQVQGLKRKTKLAGRVLRVRRRVAVLAASQSLHLPKQDAAVEGGVRSGIGRALVRARETAATMRALTARAVLAREPSYEESAEEEGGEGGSALSFSLEEEGSSPRRIFGSGSSRRIAPSPDSGPTPASLTLVVPSTAFEPGLGQSGEAAAARAGTISRLTTNRPVALLVHAPRARLMLEREVHANVAAATRRAQGRRRATRSVRLPATPGPRSSPSKRAIARPPTVDAVYNGEEEDKGSEGSWAAPRPGSGGEVAGGEASFAFAVPPLDRRVAPVRLPRLATSPGEEDILSILPRTHAPVGRRQAPPLHLRGDVHPLPSAELPGSPTTLPSPTGPRVIDFPPPPTAELPPVALPSPPGPRVIDFPPLEPEGGEWAEVVVEPPTAPSRHPSLARSPERSGTAPHRWRGPRPPAGRPPGLPLPLAQAALLTSPYLQPVARSRMRSLPHAPDRSLLPPTLMAGNPLEWARRLVGAGSPPRDPSPSPSPPRGRLLRSRSSVPEDELERAAGFDVSPGVERHAAEDVLPGAAAAPASRSSSAHPRSLGAPRSTSPSARQLDRGTSSRF